MSTEQKVLTDPHGTDFPKGEEAVLEYWKQIDAFQTSLKQSREEKRPVFTFYDGPPFATGLPHYGHILAGSIKDIVTRWAHQTGHHVERRFGWDTHGLPVEYEIDKKLGIKSSEDVRKMGIDTYNEECRGIVQRYASEWRGVITRLGRWIDFDNDYKTLDTSFMESVWWVFSELTKKDLVYQGFKVMPFSTACKTPLSNFESGQNYKDVQDPAVVVTFPLVDDEKTAFVAWTTTPWTLPSNLALCVGPDLDYVKVLDTASGMHYILGENRLVQLYPAKKGKKKKKDTADATPPYKIVDKFKGSTLQGIKYVPLFEYFRSEEAKYPAQWSVQVDSYVTDDSGTMVVHQAPAFGEDDYRVCLAGKVVGKGNDIPCPVDDDGNFTSEVTDFAGRYVKEADRDIIKHLQKNGRLIQDGTLMHSYPHCWRSDTPLIYRAVPSWFVDVPSIRDKVSANNLKTYWVPQSVRDNRFGDWLANARPWAISRNRYWGTPLPIWQSEDRKETVFIGSIAELKEKTGTSEDITDLHMHNIDHLTIPSARGPEFGVLKRVPEVFDCWFESGSMPYGQAHYPFENKDAFQEGFPADFIAEGLDQTRGWFYTLMVIATALFDKPAFKNLIVNGMVLAADGKKMSKRLKNYPDPQIILDSYGADALRIYLINSPVVKALPLAFEEQGVRGVVRDIFIPWYNSFKLFMDSKPTDFTYNVNAKSSNLMDNWILASLNSLLQFVKEEMAAYRLYTVIPKLLTFVDDLSKWYIRFNKDRLKGFDGTDQQTALNTLYEVLQTLNLLMAPFTPFLVERMYQSLRPLNTALAGDECASVHFLMMPEVDTSKIDVEIEEQVDILRRCIDLGRRARDKIVGVSFRMPLQSVTLSSRDAKSLDLMATPVMQTYLERELNVKKVIITSDYASLATLGGTPNNKSIGKRLGKQRKEVVDLVNKFTQLELSQLDDGKNVSVTTKAGAVVDVFPEDLALTCVFSGDAKAFEAATEKGWLLILPRVPDAECAQEGLAREVMAKVQRARKDLNLKVSDKIRVLVCGTGAAMKACLAKKDFMSTGLRSPVELQEALLAENAEAEHGRVEAELNGDKLTVILFPLKE